MKRLVIALGFALVGCGSSSDGGGGGGGPQQDPEPLASGITISQVAAYQTLRSTLMKDGQPFAAPEVPVIAGKPAMVRVFVAPGATWSPREVIVRLSLADNGTVLPSLDQHVTIAAASTDADLTSTINFDLTAEQVTPGLTFAVAIRETTMGVQADDVAGAIYPTDGFVPMSARDTGANGIQVVIVPIRYDADGSGRLPDTSDAQLALLRDEMYALYPVQKIDITIGAPLAWSTVVSANGSGWGRLLNAVITRRYQDHAVGPIYYYGMFQPGPSMATFCGSGCVAGLSSASSNPDDEFARASIGLGYRDKYAGTETTFVHEVGHAHGRQHAPCQVPDPDPEYPYADGEIGDWGYDLANKKLIDPAGKARDMMGYCDPDWISDYTFNALVERVSYLNGTARKIGGPQPEAWVSYVIDEEGAHRGDTMTIAAAPTAATRLVERISGTSAEQVETRFYPFDHVPGGILLVREADAAGTLRIDGKLVVQ
jgi:Peptidase M66